MHPLESLESGGRMLLEPGFSACMAEQERAERLWTGGRWCEGPVWLAAQRKLVWSDIPNNRMLCLDEQSGAVGIFRAPANNSNGNTVDHEGRLITCEHLSRQVVRTEHDGRQTTLASHWQGLRLNSPNDVVVHADGGIWFTDPPYGILSDYEGQRADSEIGASQLYRIDPHSGAVELMADGFDKPNGLAFSSDGRQLYVSDTGASHTPDGPRHIERFTVGSDGRTLRGRRVFAQCTSGLFDGFRLDTKGRLWTSAGDGVHCYDAGGTLLGKLLLPEMTANLCFGGPLRNRLYICATSSIYAITLNVTGA